MCLRCLRPGCLSCTVSKSVIRLPLYHSEQSSIFQRLALKLKKVYCLCVCSRFSQSVSARLENGKLRDAACRVRAFPIVQ